MAHTEQFEYVCPQCRKRTIVSGEPAEDTPIWCPKCEIEMTATASTGLAAAAAANEPESSSNKPKTTKAAAVKKTRASAATKTPKVAAEKKPKKLTAAAIAAAAPPTPEYGEFRCGCCGFTKTVSAAEVKAGFVQRCPSCFVKLDWIKF
jgi:DNA-directed RNA polymerase subunit RPC12/RpoP